MNNLIKIGAAVLNNRFTNHVLTLLVFLILGFYVYFANAAVLTLSSLEKTEEAFNSLSVQVSDMESARLSKESSISNKLASDLGFVEVKEKTFIMKNQPKTAFLFDQGERQ